MAESSSHPAMACPSDLELEALLLGDVRSDALSRLHDHSARCSKCRAVIAAIARVKTKGGAGGDARSSDAARTEPDAVGSAASLFAGSRVGRFVIERELGRGGMGVVFAAHDETLQRLVAIKILETAPARRPAALLSEARAMARVDHPNVVAVYETSLVEGHVYLVMDYVDGPNLAQWLRSERSVAEVTRCFVGAAMGLTAIHAAGLVHRDFKPHNVMIGADGRARVTDFGLSRAAHVEEAGAGPLDASPTPQQTHPGKVRGTPRYMAPEQTRGGEVGPAADQFAFCASLYEALTGVAPFAAGSLRSRLEAIEAGRIEPAPPGCTAPRGLLRIATRGMQADPRRRFAGMGDVAHALRRELGRSSKTNAVVVASVAVSAALGLGVVMGESVHVDPCAERTTKAAELWTPQRRATLTTTLTAAGGTQSQVQRTVDALDQYRRAHDATDRQACEATFVTREVSESMYDRMMACLGSRRARMAATIGVLEEHAAAVVPEGARVVLELPRPEPCANAERLIGTQPLPDGAAERVAVRTTEAELAVVEALIWAGMLSPARAKLDALGPHLATMAWPPLLAKSNAIEADLAMREGRTDVSLRAWRRAYAQSLTARDADLTARTAINGVLLLTKAKRLDTAAFFLATVEGLVEAGGIEHLDAVVQSQHATLAYHRGDLDAAEQHLRRFAALAARPGEQPNSYPIASRNLATLLFARGKIGDAVDWARRATQIGGERYGLDHPGTLTFRTTYALYLSHDGQLAAAEAELAATLEAAVRAELRQREARARFVLADIHRRRNDHAAALAEDREALAAYAELYPADNRRVVQARAHVGLDLLELGRPADAAVELRSAAADVHYDPQLPEAFGPPVASTLARALAAMGDLEGAAATIADAKTRIASVPGLTNHYLLLNFALDAARIEEERGRGNAMLTEARWADRIAEGRDLSSAERGLVDDTLARARRLVADAPAAD